MRIYIRVILVLMVLLPMFKLVFSAVDSLSDVPKWYAILGDRNLIDSIKASAIQEAKDAYCEYWAISQCSSNDCIDDCLEECSSDDDFDCCHLGPEGIVCEPECQTSSSSESDCLNCMENCNQQCINVKKNQCLDNLQNVNFNDFNCLKKLSPFYEGHSSCSNLLYSYYMAALMNEIKSHYLSGQIILNRNSLSLLIASSFPTSAPWGNFYLKVGNSVIYNGIENRYFDEYVSPGNITLKYWYVDYDYKCVAHCAGGCNNPLLECLPKPAYCTKNGVIYDTENQCLQNCVCDCKCVPTEIPGEGDEGENPPEGFSTSPELMGREAFNVILPKGIVYSALPPTQACHGVQYCQRVIKKYITSSLNLTYYAVPCSSSSDCPGNSFCIDKGWIDSPSWVSVKIRREFQSSSTSLQSSQESYNIPMALSAGFCNYDPRSGKVVGLDVNTLGAVVSTEGVHLATFPQSESKLYVVYNSSIFGKFLTYGCFPGLAVRSSPSGNSHGCCYQDECWSGNGCVPSGTVLSIGNVKYYCKDGSWYALGSCYDIYGITCPQYKPYYLKDTGGCYDRNEFQNIASNYLNRTCYTSLQMGGVPESCVKGIVVNDNLMNVFECCPKGTCAYNFACYGVGSWINHTDGRNYVCWSNYIWRDPDREESICKALGYNYSEIVDWCFKVDNTGKYYCEDQGQYSPSEVNIPSCCGDDPNEQWSCSPLNPNDCACVPKGYCYHNDKVYAPNRGFYNFHYDKSNITNRIIEYWKCVNGIWKKEDLNTNPSLCSPYSVVLNATIGEGIFPAYIVNITANGQFDILLGKFARYRGSGSLGVGSFITKNARVESIIPVSIEGTGSDVNVRWSFLAYVFQGNGGMCCGDQGNESLGNRVCIPANKDVPYLTCDSSPFDYTCLILSEGGPVNCEEICNRTHLGYKCTQECENYNSTIPGILYCVYDGDRYPPGSMLFKERVASYGIENITVNVLPYYYMYSSYNGISDSPFVTGIPIYRGNVTFIYNKSENKLKVSFSEKREYPIVCVNGIWYGSCGNGYCEKDLGENARTCPEDCCTKDCIDKSTNKTSPFCVGFNGCSLPKGCLEGMGSICIIKINNTYPANDNYCNGDVCSWINYSGFNIIETGAVYDCKKDVISNCGEVAIGATIMKYFRYSPYVSLLDWNALSKGITVNTQCVESRGGAYCKIENETFDSDKLKGVCEALKGVWLENNSYCKTKYRYLNLTSCCCGDDVGEIPYEEKYIDFLGRLDTGRFYCHTNPLHCHFELENGSFVDVYYGDKLNITVNLTSPNSNCNLTRYFENAFKFIVFGGTNQDYWNASEEELKNCYDKVNYIATVIRSNGEKEEYDIKDEIYLKVGNMIKNSTFFNATLFPGIYKCQDGYFVLMEIPQYLKMALLNASNITITSLTYPIKLSYGVNWTYSFGVGVGESLGQIETPYRRRYSQQEVEGWK